MRLPAILLSAMLWCVGAAGEPAAVTAALGAIPTGARWSVAAADCAEGGGWLVRRQADTACALASTTKVLTTVAALRRLGADYRFRTRVVAPAGSTADLPWLGVIGGGDPTFDEHYVEDASQVFADWARDLRTAGVRRVGDLVIDGSMFGGPIRPATYPQDGNNPIAWFSAPASAFACNDNCITVRARPGGTGDPCVIDLRPKSQRITVSNRTRTVAKGGDRTFQVDRDREANAVTVTGSYSEATAWFDMAMHADPDLMAGDQLKAMLNAAGITVTGTVRRGSVDPAAGRVLVDNRRGLIEALTTMNVRSQNFYAEQVLRVVGSVDRGEGSIAAGTAAVRAAVAELVGGEAPSLTVLDGSGLSYGNQASATLMVRVLAAMDRSSLGATFRGTLKDRTVAGLTAKVKTGTLAVATCLVGYVEGRRRIAFAILLNRGESNGIGWAPGVRDRLLTAIAELAR